MVAPPQKGTICYLQLSSSSFSKLAQAWKPISWSCSLEEQGQSRPMLIMIGYSRDHRRRNSLHHWFGSYHHQDQLRFFSFSIWPFYFLIDCGSLHGLPFSSPSSFPTFWHSVSAFSFWDNFLCYSTNANTWSKAYWCIFHSMDTLESRDSTLKLLEHLFWGDTSTDWIKQCIFWSCYLGL